MGDSKPVLHVKFPSVPVRSPGETARLGRALAKRVYPGLLVLLMGDLGSGKTFLAQSVGSSLGAGDMRSPTFTIEFVHKLPGKNFSIAHFDLYRLGSRCGDGAEPPLDGSSDIVMQMEERVGDGDLVLVEWGERWSSPPQSDRWDIRILSGMGDDRTIEFSACGERALAALSEAYADILDILRFLEANGPC